MIFVQTPRSFVTLSHGGQQQQFSTISHTTERPRQRRWSFVVVPHEISSNIEKKKTTVNLVPLGNSSSSSWFAKIFQPSNNCKETVRSIHSSTLTVHMQNYRGRRKKLFQQSTLTVSLRSFLAISSPARVAAFHFNGGRKLWRRGSFVACRKKNLRRNNSGKREN